MGAEKALRSALDRLFEIVPNGRSLRGASKAELKAQITRDSLHALIGNADDVRKVSKIVSQLLEDLLAQTRLRKKALGILSFEDERALCARAVPRGKEPPPVKVSRNDRRVQAAKESASEQSKKRVQDRLKSSGLSDRQIEEHLAAIDRIYNFGLSREVSTKLSFFLGHRVRGANATAQEIAWAREATAVREDLMARFHAAALGKEKNFLVNVSKRVEQAVSRAPNRDAAMREAKEILRDEFATMRGDALDEVLANLALVQKLEAMGFKVKNMAELKGVKNAKYLPRLYFEAQLGGRTLRIGFDIDHAQIGFAESRTDFVEGLLAGGKPDPKLLKPIFDRSNFTLETARHNRVYLEGVRREADKYQALEQAAGASAKGLRKGAAAEAALAAAEAVKTLDAMKKTSDDLRQLMAVVSTLEDSPAKREMMDTLAELASIFGETL